MSTGPDELVAQYAAAREGVALADLSDRGVLAVTGPDRQKYLHNVLSNDVLGREPGRGCLAAFMTVKGHLLALMRALVTKDAVLLEVPPSRLKPVEEGLLNYRVGAPVRFAARPVSVLGLLGPGSRDALARAGCEVPDLAPESHTAGHLAGHEVRVARATDLPGTSFVLYASLEAAPAVRDALVSAGACPIGRETLDVLRVEAGRPWYGPDITEEHLLHETGLLAEYHSAAKGCYIGQEVVARLEARGGHVNKRVRGLRLAAPAAPGGQVVADGKEVGRVTTAGISPRLGPIAMAFVHRSHFEPGTAVEVGGAPATVVVLPFEPIAGWGVDQK